MWIDAQIVIDVVAVIRIGVILENRREPDGSAAEPGDVVQVACNALYVSSEERVGSVDAGSSVSPAARGTDDVILKPVDNEEVNELLPPLAVDSEIFLARNWGEIELLD